jgi:transposase
LASPDALAVLAAAPTPARGQRLTVADLMGMLGRAGRRRELQRRAEAIHQALQAEQLAAPALLADAYGASVAAIVGVLTSLSAQIDSLHATLSKHFEQHPDAEILRSLPGLGVVLGARVLGEFGDDPDRYLDAKAGKNYAGTAPITSTVRQAPDRAGPLCAHPAPGRPACLVGVLLVDLLARCSRLL